MGQRANQTPEFTRLKLLKQSLLTSRPIDAKDMKAIYKSVSPEGDAGCEAMLVVPGESPRLEKTRYRDKPREPAGVANDATAGAIGPGS